MQKKLIKKKLISEDNYYTLSNRLFSVDSQMDYLPSFLGAEYINVETPFNLNFSSKSSEEVEDDFNIPNNADSYTFISSILGPNPMPSFNEIFPFNSNDSENKDESFSSSSSSLFTNLNKNSILVKEDEKDENMLKRKRFKERRPRKIRIIYAKKLREDFSMVLY